MGYVFTKDTETVSSCLDKKQLSPRLFYYLKFIRNRIRMYLWIPIHVFFSTPAAQANFAGRQIVVGRHCGGYT